MFKTITKAAVMAVVAGGLSLTAAAPAQAQAPEGPATGILCGFGSVTDPTIENGEVQTGEIDGGPLVATAPGATISMTCTIQVGAANSTHAGANSAVAGSSPSVQATAVPPTLVSYLSPEGQPVYMCTEATVNGVTYYYDSVSEPGGWSLSSSVGCSEAISQEIFPGPLGPVLDILFPILDGVFTTVDGILHDLFVNTIDPVICPILAGIFPPEGDIPDLGWDCPPYNS